MSTSSPRAASTGAQWGRRVAVITVVRDEAKMLPRWLSHYGSELGYQSLIVLDDNMEGGSTDDLPGHVQAPRAAQVRRRFADEEVLRTTARARESVHRLKGRGHPRSFWAMSEDEVADLLTTGRGRRRSRCGA